MRTIKLILSYDGTDFAGWQTQRGCRTVQATLEETIEKITGAPSSTLASGRTDAGVHALAQVASFALTAPIPPENLHRALNRTLPASIRILEARTVRSTFHARHSAVAKTYEYRVFLEKLGRRSDERQAGCICPPFLAPYVYAYPWPLDVAALGEAARAFVGRHDFLSFAATDPDLTSRDAEPGAEPGQQVHAPPAPAIRTIFSSTWEQRQTADGNLLVYRVRGSGFLHHMVRNLVGTQLDVGRGRLQASEIPAILAARARAAAGPTAPARGLFLHSVEYDGAE